MKRVLLVALAAAVVLYLLTGLTQVRPGERAVVRRFGRVVAQPGPGLWVGLPWGMDRVDRVAVDQLRRVTVGYRPEADASTLTTPPGQVLTGDHNLVNVQAVLNCAVRPDGVVDFLVHGERADELVARVAEAAVAEWVGGRTVDDVLLHGKVDLPAWLAARVRERIEPYGIGVEVREASVTHLAPPDEVKASFDAVTQAQTEMRTRLYSAEQEAGRSLRGAEAEGYRQKQLALAYAGEKKALARAEGQSFLKRLEVYRRMKESNPEALAAIWWDEMGRLLAGMREGGRVDLLDRHLGAEGLDITTIVPPKKK